MDLFNIIYSTDFAQTVVNVVTFLGVVEFIGTMFFLIGNIRR